MPRVRHEDEATFPLFGARYFENRTFGFELEDFTSVGDGKVKMTIRSHAPMGDHAPFNLRLFHVDGPEGGDFSQFMINMNWDVTPGLDRLDAHTATYTVTHNNRTGQLIKVGDILDLEFGFFFDQSQVEGQTAYYTLSLIPL